ncbi:MAG: AAA family ATPase [Candidatus Tectomicrobia bacterium]|uniref:AAA family ATPase n=1 Tax=Tectimicrobiota bacterium TaxID=2528274 RepID=A0A933LRE4_UNCTE|nr:AAA family ATPase [Candidatus Tectomicrobia bacterium]
MIKKLTVKNYKSLKELTISFQPLTILAGPNASGKTNILDALSFVCDFVQGKNPLDSRGKDFRLLAWGGYPEPVSIAIQGSFLTGEKGEGDFEYSFETKTEHDQVLIGTERCVLVANHEAILENDTSHGYKIFRHNELKESGTLSGQESAFKRAPSGHPELMAVKSALTDCVFYDFIPWKMKQWQDIEKQNRLEAAGENVATLLHSIQRAESPLYQNILERLKAAIPRVEAIETDLTDERPVKTYVQLREKGIPQPIKSFSISEGTFRILGMLLALFAPNPASLVAIEGPETNVHPHLFANIADYLKVASKKRQIIVTTHSPHFIKQFNPENLVIVEMKNGATRCRPVAGKRGLKEALKVLDLGELYYSGELGGMP